MATGFDAVAEGVTISLEPLEDEAFAIVISRDGKEIRADEGVALLGDPASLGRVIDGMLADLSAAEGASV